MAKNPIDLVLLRSAEEKFRSLVGEPDERGCRQWKGSCYVRGYGRFNNGRKQRIYAHRAAYALRTNQDPGEDDVCHTCDNPPCCADEHLFRATHAENQRDMARKGRNPGNRINHPQPKGMGKGRVFTAEHKLHLSLSMRGNKNGKNRWKNRL